MTRNEQLDYLTRLPMPLPSPQHTADHVKQRNSATLPIVIVNDEGNPDEKPEKPTLADAMWHSFCLLVSVLSHLLVGPILIILNRHLLKEVGFGYPLIVTSLGQVSRCTDAFVRALIDDAGCVSHGDASPRAARADRARAERNSIGAQAKHVCH